MSVNFPETIRRTGRYRPVMAETRKTLGPKIRSPIKDFLDDVVAELGDQRGMQQWAVEAALLMFLDADPEMQKNLISRVRDADFNGGTIVLVREIKAQKE